MRNLLRNKWSVGVLAVVAVFSIVHQVRQGGGFSAGGGAVMARQAEASPDLGAESVGLATATSGDPKVLVGTNNLASLRQTLAGLISEYPAGAEVRRDPFSREILHHVPSDTAETEVEVAAPVIPIKLELQALSIQGGASFAVVNGRVVGAGDKLGPFEVESVLAEGVWLRGTNGRQCLKIDFLTPLKKSDDDPESAPKP